MINISFELDGLRINLLNKGLAPSIVDKIIDNARAEIHEKLKPVLDSALQSAVESGVDKKSAEFINELLIDEQNMSIRTKSGNVDFSEPPFPMLPKLLVGGKPMKDGSGVYRVIPVGENSSSSKKTIASNIFDEQKRINTERAEAAKKTYSSIAPSGSKTNFRTATSRQNSATDWVMPAKEKDFTEDLHSINTDIGLSAEEIIKQTIREFEDGY